MNNFKINKKSRSFSSFLNSDDEVVSSSIYKININDNNIAITDDNIKKIKIIKELIFFIYKEIHSKNLIFGTSEDGSFYTTATYNSTTVFDETKRLGELSSFYQENVFYTPPECIYNFSYNGISSDMWILGCFIYKIYFGKDLFLPSSTSTSTSTSLKNDVNNINDVSDSDLQIKYKHIALLKERLNKFSLNKFLKYLLKNNTNTLIICLLKDTLNKNFKKRPKTEYLLIKYFNYDSNSLIALNPPTFIIANKNFLQLEDKLTEFFNYKKVIYDEITNYLHLNSFTQGDLNFIENVICSFVELDNLYNQIMNDSNLFFVKFIMIVKTAILYLLIKKSFIHPIKDEIFINDFYVFKKTFNIEEQHSKKNNLISIGLKIFNFIDNGNF